jgi:hypothetical protein
MTLRRRGRLQGDRGQVGGIEALPFGLLVFVVGGLLLANAWAVVDAKLATDAAAREATRAFVEAPDLAAALEAADAAARQSVNAHGRDGDRAEVAPIGPVGFARCERVTIEVAYDIPAITLPLVGGWGSSPFPVRSRHSEVVDPFRSGVPGEAGGCA